MLEVRNFQFKNDDNHSIFAGSDYLKSDCNDFNWLGGFDGNSLKFLLPYRIYKKLFFKYIMFTTETIYLDDISDVNDEKDFLNKAVSFLRKKNIDFIIQPPTYAVFKIYPDKASFAEFGSFIIDLTLTESQIWSNIHPKHRNVIKNAEKKGVVIKRGIEYLDIAYELYIKTLKRSNITGSLKDKLLNLVDNIKNNITVFIAFYNGEPQGCAIMPYNCYSAYYIYGGSIEKPLTGAVNLLHWEAIKYFKTIKTRYYDFVGARLECAPGSKYESLQKFKSRFGGSLKKGYLWKYPLHKSKYMLYNLLLKLGNKKHSDIIDQIGMKD